MTREADALEKKVKRHGQPVATGLYRALDLWPHPPIRCDCGLEMRTTSVLREDGTVLGALCSEYPREGELGEVVLRPCRGVDHGCTRSWPHFVPAGSETVFLEREGA